MLIAHFSDTHLGYRAYSKQNANGLNQREVDVFQTFQKFLDRIMDDNPDVILHTGDFFHIVRPSNHVIVAAFQELSKLQQKRNNLPFVIVAGNHETPRSADSGCILRLFGNSTGTGSIPGVFVIIDEIQTLDLLDAIRIQCVPTRGLPNRHETSFRPDDHSKTNIIAIHGLDAMLGYGSVDFDVNEFYPHEWDFVALGDYHIRKELDSNCAYSGSTDYTSSNFWEEINTQKGYYLIDTDAKSREFIDVDPIRPAFDLPAINAEGLTAEEVAHQLKKNANWNPGSMPIVRQTVVGLHPVVRAELSTDILRDLKASCLHYQLNIVAGKPETLLQATGSSTVHSLEEEWLEFSKSFGFAPSINRESAAQLGTQLLEEARDAVEQS